MSTLDISIFEDNQSKNCSNGDYEQCAAVNRLIVAMKYYSNLNVKNDENDREIFRSFMDLYSQFVDDNNHLMAFHSDTEQLQRLCHRFSDKGMCAMNGCTATQRHFESESIINIKDDQMINFHVNLFDALHFWIFHCFDGGFRVQQNENKQNENDVDGDTLFDAEFARINAIIRKSDLETTSFERISNENNSKFTLSKSERGDTTFLDQLYKHLMLEFNSMHVEKLRCLIDSEFYDSESIKMDVSNYGNIKTCKDSVLRFIKAINVQSSTFSVGLRFYYWPYYEQRDELPANEQMFGGWDKKHDHGGYKISELCIKRKYGSFKEECTNYPNFSNEQFEEAKTKTTQFMKSTQIKQMHAKYTYHDKYRNEKQMFLHYDIPFGALVSFHHILSLIFYTDYSKLCTAFSATFRRIHSFETLKSIKERNALYFWMSKYLRELVELFGRCSCREKDKESGKWISLKGPFYCGMNYQMNIGSFAMRLNSPSSTSKTFEVAVKFSGPNGVVFTFDCPENDRLYQYLRSFPCSHISRFKEEDECLFFGGFWRIKVVNVRLIKTKENLKKFVSALFKFDKFLTGESVVNMSKNECFLIGSLVHLALNKNEMKVTVPQYVLDCFAAFRQNKKSVVLDLFHLNMANERIQNLLFYSLDDSDKEIQNDDNDLCNLVHSNLFILFPNVQSLTIDTMDHNNFCFSLKALLNVIFGTNLNEITIKSKEDFNDYCWIKSVWDSDEGILKNEYAAKGYKIAMDRKEIDHFGDEYILRINAI